MQKIHITAVDCTAEAIKGAFFAKSSPLERQAMPLAALSLGAEK